MLTKTPDQESPPDISMKTPISYNDSASPYNLKNIVPYYYPERIVDLGNSSKSLMFNNYDPDVKVLPEIKMKRNSRFNRDKPLK